MHQPCLSFPISYLRLPTLRRQRCQPALLTPSRLRELSPTEPITQGFVKSPWCSTAQRSHLGTEDEARTRLSLVTAAAAWRVCRSCRPQVTPSPRWSPACPRHRDRIIPAVWELGWEELGQHHHPGPPTGVKGQPDPLKPPANTGTDTSWSPVPGEMAAVPRCHGAGWLLAQNYSPAAHNVYVPPGPCSTAFSYKGRAEAKFVPHLWLQPRLCPPQHLVGQGKWHIPPQQHRMDEKFPAG